MNDKNLPSNWAHAPLGDVASIDSDLVDPAQDPQAPHIAPNHIESGTGRLLPHTTVAEDKVTSPKHRFRAGHILYSKIRPYLAKAVLVDFEGLCSADMYPISTQMDAAYLHRWLISNEFTARVSQDQGRTVLPKVNQAALVKIEVPVPPLAEQRRIVSKLESLLARSRRAKEALDAIPALLERMRQSVLAAAFRGDLTADWRAQHPDVEPASKLLERIRADRRLRWEEAELAKMRAKGKVPKDDSWKARYEAPCSPETRSLPELPHGWSWVKLPELGEMARGKSKHRPRNDPRLFGGPYPFIQTGDVANSNGLIQTASQHYSEFGMAQSRLSPKGTVCITIAANIADSAILDIDACFPDSIVGIIPDTKLVSPEYLELFIRTAKANLSAFAPATAQKNINLEVLSEVSIPVPPRKESARIEKILNQAFKRISAIEQAHTSSTSKLLALESSVLAKSFRGELVPQDPDDEPASVLLERIRAEREATAGSAPKRPRGRRPAA